MNRLLLVVTLFVAVGCGKSEEEQARAAREQATLTAAKNADIGADKAKLDKLTGDLKHQTDAEQAAQSQLTTATTDADRTAAKAKIAAAQAEQKRIQAEITAVQSGSGAPSKGGTTPRPACTCQANDPLCSCM